MINTAKILSLLIVIILCISCDTEKKEKHKTNEPTSLKNSFKEDFLIGTALNTGQIKEVDTVQTALITKEFNAITPENDLKWEQIHPKKDTYNFDVSDAYVAFGNKNNMHVVGHTLLWHSQLAPWVHEIKNKDTLVHHITNHINTIAGRYKGKIDSWDVVNEALNEDGSPRESIFYKLFGDESYLELAFKLAAKSAPDAQLVYNDYNLWKPAKREGVIRIVKNLQAKGIKIDGVGMHGPSRLVQADMVHQGFQRQRKHPGIFRVVHMTIVIYPLGSDLSIKNAH